MEMEGGSMEFTVDTAESVARLAHFWQTDAGDPDIPYVNHPEAVHRLLVASNSPYAKDPLARMLAWLHDTAEDTWVTAEHLQSLGAPEELLMDLDAITKRLGETRVQYYARVMGRPRAHAVKVFDVQHNSQPERLAKVAERDPERAERMAKKYAYAKTVLGDGPGTV